MDLELDRCRRTDGRKWRCSKNAVPNQKYCELHMHRGRQGSRKRVEPNANFSKPDNKIQVDYRMPINPSVSSDVDYKIALSAKNSVGYNRPSEKGSHAEAEEKALNLKKKHGMSRSNDVGFVFPGFGSSPKSVHHCGAGKVCPGSGTKNAVESVRQRCRRTDGKKWQCGFEALPNQKYCQRHMHRGSKRATLNSANNFPAPSSGRDDGVNLNTIPASPRHVSGENSSTSSSDATTITDENISFCLAQSLTKCKNYF